MTIIMTTACPSHILVFVALACVAGCKPDCDTESGQFVTDRRGYHCTPVPGDSDSSTSEDPSSTTEPEPGTTTTTSSQTDTTSEPDTTATTEVDLSTSTGIVAECGNGIVDDGEDCDDGDGSPQQTANCEAGCTFPSCGDFIVNTHTGEACDDGMVQTPDCEADCTLPQCGDGIHNPHANEQCDDGNNTNGDGCASDCVEERFVFVSGELFHGDMSPLMGPPDNPQNLQGLPLADHRCQTLATNASLPGTYKAWLSTDQDAPAIRFDTNFEGRYILPDPNVTIVAIAWQGLSSGSLQSPITANQLGDPTTGNVWTNTLANGNVRSPQNHCQAFTAKENTDTTSIGFSNATDTTWTEGAEGQLCSNTLRLYCIQDPA